MKGTSGQVPCAESPDKRSKLLADGPGQELRTKPYYLMRLATLSLITSGNTAKAAAAKRR